MPKKNTGVTVEVPEYCDPVYGTLAESEYGGPVVIITKAESQEIVIDFEEWDVEYV
jgi:hypothetical protein